MVALVQAMEAGRRHAWAGLGACAPARKKLALRMRAGAGACAPAKSSLRFASLRNRERARPRSRTLRGVEIARAFHTSFSRPGAGRDVSRNVRPYIVRTILPKFSFASMRR